MVDVDGIPTAFIEDTGSGNIGLFHLGEAVNGRKITKLTLDRIEVTDADGNARQVALGQTLEGVEAPSLLDRANATLNSVSPSPSPGMARPSGPTAEAVNDIIAKLKARRAQQVGGGK